MKAVFDTNILIDYLNGISAARDELARFDEPRISAVTWMEVMVGIASDEEEVVRRFLKRFLVVHTDSDICEQAVALRRERRIRLPDAIVWATARADDALMITRNTKDFPAEDPGIRIPYQI